MKKRIISLLLIAVMVLSMSTVAYADELEGGKDWVVWYDGSRLNSNFTTDAFHDAIRGMQPGDRIVFEVSVENRFTKDADWWMNNKVLDSFEDNSIANGGAYTYKLVYTNTNGEDEELYNSDTVGGEGRRGGEGLHQATGALENYFYLDNIGAGKNGKVTLEISLDGETQGNDYQDTIADLQLSFAVDTTSTTGDKTTTGNVPKTGDETNMIPYLIAAGVSGIGCLIVAIILIKRRKNDDEEEGSEQ